MVIYLERGADLHMAQLMPLPLTVSCFSKIQIGFTSLLPAYTGSPGQRAVKWVCVCLCFYKEQQHEQCRAVHLVGTFFQLEFRLAQLLLSRRPLLNQPISLACQLLTS